VLWARRYTSLACVGEPHVQHNMKTNNKDKAESRGTGGSSEDVTGGVGSGDGDWGTGLGMSLEAEFW